MRYVIADIHGCYNEYRQLLEKIDFSQKDELYVLGDAVDRGPEPIKVLEDMMMRPNVIYMLGNHEYMMLKVLSRLDKEITSENAEEYLDSDDITAYIHWMQDGGEVTCRHFRALPAERRRDILEYIEDAWLYDEVEAGRNTFILAHAGIHHFNEKKSLEAYDFTDFIFYRCDYGRRYYRDKNTYLVTGHTPTMNIRADKKPLVYREKGHIAIDCGCVFGGNLAAFCLETGEVTYVERNENV